jgi:1,4-dihydroxy-6-naphthoate synthase
MSKDPNKLRLHIGHSPDPDDAFMWFPLANVGPGSKGEGYHPLVDTKQFEFEHVLQDIQTLNERSERGDLEVTAISIHQYPHVADRYALTSCGSSMGDNYGPMVVSPRQLDLEDLRHCTIAIPGERTTAFLALSLLLGRGEFRYDVVPFDQIISEVANGRFDAGLIIHEGQLTYAEAGLKKAVDLGQWWKQEHNLPLPLGGNAIRRDLGEQTMREVCGVLLKSIEYALAHRQDAVKYAMAYARDMGEDLADKFVGMYVNKWTLDYGPTGRLAVNKLLSEGARAGLCPAVGDVKFVDPL